jgi:hypothetical protein
MFPQDIEKLPANILEHLRRRRTEVLDGRDGCHTEGSSEVRTERTTETTVVGCRAEQDDTSSS